VEGSAVSGRRAGIDRHVEREEERLEKERASGEISEGEYDDRMKAIHDEARDAYNEAYAADQEDLEDEWGY